MAKYTMSDIRNIVLLGHASAGKTTLAEAMLHKTGVTTRLGSIDDKSSTLDSDEEERERGHSVDTGLAHVTAKGKEINIIDTPGYPDFIGQPLTAMTAAETAVIVISAADGIQMVTRKMFEAAKNRGMACVFVINKIDSGAEDVMRLVEAIQESFGMACRCANIPSADGKQVLDAIYADSGDGGVIDVAEAHTELMETIIEADEELMEAYLGGETIPPEKLGGTFCKGLVSQAVMPIFFTSARQEVGIDELLGFLAETSPSPQAGLKPAVVKEVEKKEDDDEGIEREEITPSADGDALGLVFRVGSDPKSHIKNCAVRLFRGALKSDTPLLATDGKKGMRAGQIQKAQGDKLDSIDDGIAGDIVVLSKLEDLQVLDTIFTGQDIGRIETPPIPYPMFSLAIEPKSRGDETKISGAMAEIQDADPTFMVSRDTQTAETLVSGIGELHLRVMLSRLHKRRGLEVTTKPPLIPYRETITSSAKYVEYTHKKQSGGAGQFARVFIDMEPNERGEGYEFVDKIFGGSIDQPFRPSVDKGCQAAMQQGVLAGFPVVDVKISLVDGKTHPVDSKDIAFQIAGREAFRKAFMQCNPSLLEPIVNLEVTVPSEYVGDITGDLSSRRGRVQGQDMLPGNMTVIKAQVPLAEIQQYNSQLKSVTGGQGSYAMEFSHYETVPGNVQQQVVAKRKAEQEEAAS